MYLSLDEAAQRLGMSASGLRKIVDATRANTAGPQIQFYQRKPHSPILFRADWIDQFIDEHTTKPAEERAIPRPHIRTKQNKSTVQSKSRWSQVGPAAFGLDPSALT